jgi:hypothetical protein
VSQENQQRLLALLLGITTVLAGLFTWRAGQLGSSAAYDDRTSIGQTIRQEEQRVAVALEAAGDFTTYIRYRADYAEAAALDAEAAQLESDGQTQLAASSAGEAASRRREGTYLAAVNGVFGRQTVLRDYLAATPEPRSFDLATHIDALAAEASAGVRSPGRLDPQRWADDANAIRDRVRGLRVATFLMVVAVVVLTLTQVVLTGRLRLVTGALGVLLATGVVFVTFATVY